MFAGEVCARARFEPFSPSPREEGDAFPRAFEGLVAARLLIDGRAWNAGGGGASVARRVVSAFPASRLAGRGKMAAARRGNLAIPAFLPLFLRPPSIPGQEQRRNGQDPIPSLSLCTKFIATIYIYIYIFASIRFASLIPSYFFPPLFHEESPDSKLLIRMIKNRISLIGWNVATCSMRATYRIVESFNDARYSPVVLNSRNFSFPNILLSVNM